MYRQTIQSYDHYQVYEPNLQGTEEFWVENDVQSRFGDGMWDRVEGDDIDGEVLDSVIIKFGQGTDQLDIPISNCTAQLLVSRDGAILQ